MTCYMVRNTNSNQLFTIFNSDAKKEYTVTYSPCVSGNSYEIIDDCKNSLATVIQSSNGFPHYYKVFCLNIAFAYVFKDVSTVIFLPNRSVCKINYSSDENFTINTIKGKKLISLKVDYNESFKGKYYTIEIDSSINELVAIGIIMAINDKEKLKTRITAVN